MFNQDQLRQVDPNVNKATPLNQAPQTNTAPTSPNQPTEANKGSLDNTDIYYMPENFQKNNHVAGKNINISGIVVLILGIFFVIFLGIGVYVYLFKPEMLNDFFNSSDQTANIELTTPIENTTPVTIPIEEVKTRPVGSPKDAYLAFRSELELADTVDKYLAVFVRYGTKVKQEQLNRQKSSLESLGSQGDILTALRGTPVPVLDGTENIQEQITDEKSTLTVTKTSGRSTGTVILLPEDNQWKISEEVWVENNEQGSLENDEPQVATDDDKDGLSNTEEELLGTNAQLVDSDDDSYRDAEELNNGYNPSGAGKLSANENLGTYLNTTFNFSLTYPIKWDRTIAKSDDSVIFTAPNNQFIQVLIQPNSNRDDIVDWYRNTFNVTTVPNSQLVINETWDGVKTTDGLTIYLTNKDKTYIFVITYNLSSSKVLEYKNIFDLMARSLNLGV